MEPIEIDVVLQKPIPVAIRWEDQDVMGTVAGGDADTLTFSSAPIISPFGNKIDVWIGGVEFGRRVIAYDEKTLTAKVDTPWSDVLNDNGVRIIPRAGDLYVIEVTEIINLPRLGADGLIPWLDEVTAERREAVRKGIKRAGITGRQLADAEASVELNAKAVITDLNIPVQTPAGMRRVLQLSLAKTDLPADKQAKVVEAIMAYGVAAISIVTRLSTLFFNGERREAPKSDALAVAREAFPGLKLEQKEAPSPLAGRGEPDQTEAA